MIFLIISVARARFPGLYLSEWEESVSSREAASDTEKTRMLLSRETVEGLYITGKCTRIFF